VRQRDVVRRALQPLMPGASYVTVTPLDENLAWARRSWWLGATMFTVFGALALVIAAFGLYSVISYTTTQQRHAMGVRLALGAQPGHLVRLVLREGLGVAVLGVTLGAAVAWWAARWAEPLLFEVSARNPWIYGITALALVVAALAASLVPALRTTRVDPALALRAE
jgi:ABC-type antimicrobial peptide transport system permease subunit